MPCDGVQLAESCGLVESVAPHGVQIRTASQPPAGELQPLLGGLWVRLEVLVMLAGHGEGGLPWAACGGSLVCRAVLQYQQLFINLVRPKPTLKTNISCMNNVFVIFSSFVYDGCVSHTDLHKHCQSWDVTLLTEVAEYKQHSSVLIHIV